MNTLSLSKDLPALSLLTVRRYIYVSTLVGVFSGILVLHIGFSLFLFDVIMLTNLLLMWSLLRPVLLPKWLVGVLVVLLLSGLVGVLRGTDSTMLFSKQIIGIGVGTVYFANFFDMQRDGIDRVFATYVKFAYLLTLLALVIWPVECLLTHKFIRLQGISSEPAAYCLLTLPAWYWYAHLWRSTGTNRNKVVWMTVALVLSGSSLGFIAAAFGLLLLFSRGRLRTLIVPFLVSGLLATIYAVSPNFRLRLDDTVSSLLNSDVSGTNISTYALVTNMFVTERVLEEHPVLGNGLGSHMMSNQRFIRDVPGVDIVESLGWNEGANTQDAASLALRVLSELGVMGLLGVLWFIAHFRVGGSGKRSAISNAIMIVFLEKLLRGGGYANPEQFFFIIMYALNYRQSKVELYSRKSGLPLS